MDQLGIIALAYSLIPITLFLVVMGIDAVRKKLN
jgi:hypothetical protein